MSAGEEYDVVIIGGGAAGLSAALLLGRARRRVAVVDEGKPRNRGAAHVHGYLTRDGIPPARFLELAREEVAGYGVELIDGTATEVAAGPRVNLQDGRILAARQVILASGLRDVLPDIMGAEGRWGKDFLQCPYCHGWEFQGEPLAILGTSGSSVQQALLVRQFSEDVTLFTHDMGKLSDEESTSLAAFGVNVVHGRVRELVPDGESLAGVRLEGGQFHSCRALFYEPAAKVDTSIIDLEDCRTSDDGCMSTDETGRTAVDGVWAVGNAADPASQVIVAAGDAYRVAVAVNAALIVDDVARARTRPK